MTQRYFATVRRVFAYALLIVLVPFLAGAVGMGIRLGFATAMLASLFGRHAGGRLVELDDVTRLRVASRRSSLTVSLDGETLHLEPPLDYRIRPQALWVIAP